MEYRKRYRWTQESLSMEYRKRYGFRKEALSTETRTSTGGDETQALVETGKRH